MFLLLTTRWCCWKRKAYLPSRTWTGQSSRIRHHRAWKYVSMFPPLCWRQIPVPSKDSHFFPSAYFQGVSHWCSWIRQVNWCCPFFYFVLTLFSPPPGASSGHHSSGSISATCSGCCLLLWVPYRFHWALSVSLPGERTLSCSIVNIFVPTVCGLPLLSTKSGEVAPGGSKFGCKFPGVKAALMLGHSSLL